MYKHLITLSMVLCVLLSFNTQVLADNNTENSTKGTMFVAYTDSTTEEVALLSSTSDSSEDSDEKSDEDEKESSSDTESSTSSDLEEEEEKEDSKSSNLIYSLAVATIAGVIFLLIFLFRGKIGEILPKSRSRRDDDDDDDDDDYQPNVAKKTYRLTGTKTRFLNQSFPIRGSVLIGRDPTRCNILFSNEAKGVSSLHCMVDIDKNGIILVDKGSTYGTFLEDRTKLEPNKPYRLREGDSFYIGTVENSFRVDI